MGRRTLLLITSILIAAIGVGLIGLYVRGANDRADQRAERTYGPRPTATATAKPTAAAQHPDIKGVGLTVEIPDPDRAVGLLRAGDWVAIYVTGKGKTDVVLPRVKVISVAGTVLALDAPLSDAVKVEQAKSEGELVVFVLGAAANSQG